MGWKDVAKDYLSFSRKERVGIIALIILIFFIWLSPRILRDMKPQRTTVDTGWVNLVKKIQPKPAEMKNEETGDENSNGLAFERSVDPTSPKAELFYFDPNKITTDQWKKLGIRDKTIHTIQNYLSKGGHFHKADDLQKVYGLKTEDYARLEPFVRIEDAVKYPANDHPAPDLKRNNPVTSNPKSKTIDINSADTTAFISLPGIGSKLSARIVNFRDKLGGFYSVDQVGETYGLADTTFQKIRKYLSLSNLAIKTFAINVATKDEMKSHPYFKWVLANAIVEYRNQHGNFSSLEDLKKISLITDETFKKIKPYLSL